MYTRRRFIGILGATAAGAGLSAGVVSQVQAALASRGEWDDRTEERIPAICQLCPGGCGLRVRVVGGMPVKIEGNPLYPVNRGGMCPKGLSALQSLYSPDRLSSPLRRMGPKGSDKWEAISWEEALKIVSERLAQLRQRGTPEALAILGGDYRGIIAQLWTRFAESFGTPNYIRMRSLKPEVPEHIASLMHGETRPITYDLSNASFVLSFGCNWLESWNAPVHQMRAYGQMRRDRRAEIVHVEPRASHSATKADVWIAIAPGTEGALALGLAHLIIREHIYDESFVDNNTFGFEDWEDDDGRKHDGFKRLVLNHYSPSAVSEITGVRPETIVNVARRFALMRPAIALGDNRSPLEAHDLFTRMAIHSLNALVGSIGVKGGVMPGRSMPPLTQWPDAVPDETSRLGRLRARLDEAGRAERFLDDDVPRGLAESILRTESSPVEVLILHRANPLYGRSDKDQFRKALIKTPLVVSLSNTPDEVSRYADLILPEHHFLEGWQDDVVTHLPGFSLFGLGRPALKPLYDTRHSGDIILELAKGVGGVVAEAFPWNSYETLLQSSVEGLFDTDQGHVASKATDELFHQVLQRQGYRVPGFNSFDEFWQALVTSGAWWDPVEPLESSRRRFTTPSEKFEFYSQALEARLQESVSAEARAGSPAQEKRRRILFALGVMKTEGDLFFPRFLQSPPGKPDPSFPFRLRTYELLTLGSGANSNCPWLQESLAVHVKASWESWVEIHPDAAGEIGVRDGDWVWVESTAGRVRVQARIYEAMRSDIVSMPVGQGHTASGRWAQGTGVDPSDISVSSTEPGEGLGIRKTTWVRIRPA